MSLLVVSYSRIHRDGVRGLIQLLSAAYRRVSKAVFWDEDFEPGEPWFKQMEAFIDEAPQLFVFWCTHASTSAQVQREYEYALTKKKRVVPVILDDTPLPAVLAPIHGVDLRGLVLPHRVPGPGAMKLTYRKRLPRDEAIAIDEPETSANRWRMTARASRLALVVLLLLHLLEQLFGWRSFHFLDAAMVTALLSVAFDEIFYRYYRQHSPSAAPVSDSVEDPPLAEAETHALVIQRFRPFLDS